MNHLRLAAAIPYVSKWALRSSVLVALLMTTRARAGDEQRKHVFSELQLELTLPALEALEQTVAPSDKRAEWSGKLGEATVRIRVAPHDIGDEHCTEPEDVAEAVAQEMRDELKKSGEPLLERLRFRALEALPGRYGHATHAALLSAETSDPAQPGVRGGMWIVAGLLAGSAYTVRIDATPLPQGAQLEALLTFARTGIVYAGAVRDTRWTDAEAAERWKRFMPEYMPRELDKVVRTPHYIILSNASGAERYGKRLEERYALFQKQLAFPEIESRRLLPVFYMRTATDLHGLVSSWMGLNHWNKDVDAFTFHDFYVTSADSNEEFEEFAEMAEQLWRNRVRANGGGMWLCRGFATLLGYPPSQRTITASQLKKGRFTPLADLFDDAAWGRRTNTEMPYGEQMSFFVEYLREAKGYKEKFAAVIQTVGMLPSDDPELMAAELTKLLGTDLKGLEKDWIAWCAKRKK
jgi:hypothetical protein